MRYPSTRRESLEGLKSPIKDASFPTHPGLWLDKFIQTTDKEDTEAKAVLVRQATEIAEPSAYRAFFERYKQSLVRAPGPVYVAEGESLGRFVVGLGAASVLETAITLHRTYGVPYIPGSALKGLASSYAATRLEDQEKWSRKFESGKTERGDYQRALFGDTEQSGLIVFYDALPLPKKYQLDKDVITVHHPEYYRGDPKPPADWDSPTPVPFITARGRFLFALGLNPVASDDLTEALVWLELAAELLHRALREAGIGAKTTIGYGRFDLQPFARLEPPRSEAFKEITDLIEFLKWNTVDIHLPKMADLWFQLTKEEKETLGPMLKKKMKSERVLESPRMKQARARSANVGPMLSELGF